MPLEIEEASNFRISEKKVFGSRSGDYMTDGDLIQFFVDTKQYFSIDEITEMLGVKPGTAKDRVNPFTGERTIYISDDEGISELDIPKLLARRINKGQHYYAFVNHDPDPDLASEHVDIAQIPDLIKVLNKDRLTRTQVEKLKKQQEEDANDPMKDPVSGEEDTEQTDEAAPATKKRKKTASRKQ